MSSGQDEKRIEFADQGVTIDARLVGEGLSLDPANVLTQMQDGLITGVCERGYDEDAGRYRLTFVHGGQQCRFIVDQDGTVQQRLIVDYGDMPPPVQRHRRSPA